MRGKLQICKQTKQLYSNWQKHQYIKVISNGTVTAFSVSPFFMLQKFEILLLIIYLKHYLEFYEWNESHELINITSLEL